MIGKYPASSAHSLVIHALWLSPSSRPPPKKKYPDGPKTNDLHCHYDGWIWNPPLRIDLMSRTNPCGYRFNYGSICRAHSRMTRKRSIRTNRAATSNLKSICRGGFYILPKTNASHSLYCYGWTNNTHQFRFAICQRTVDSWIDPTNKRWVCSLPYV